MLMERKELCRLRRKLKMVLALILACCFCPVFSLADDVGVLSETELNAWISTILKDTLSEEPLNAPVGEESRTDLGYAFLYSFATLYYDSPTLSETSVLQAIMVNDENYTGLRNIGIGTDQSALIETYGWQNTVLMGDGIFAPFYILDQLPTKAYWSWAVHDGDELLSVQCAIHVMIGTDTYTDAGIRYTLDDGVVTAIEVYGLTQTTTQAQVQSNLNAVRSAQGAGSGDGAQIEQTITQWETAAYEIANDLEPFGEADLRFASADFMNLSETGAALLWGEPMSQEQVTDDTGAMLLTTMRDGLTLSYENDTLNTLSITSDAYEGPRGITIGMSVPEVVALFETDGEGRLYNGAAILYGDGQVAPYGVMETITQTIMQVRYVADVVQGEEVRSVTLAFHFETDRLTEILIYAW